MFGRGTFGGGGFNCRTALKAIHDHGLSTGKYVCAFGCSFHYARESALFAPGWVFEEHGAANFEANQARFWAPFSDYFQANALVGLPFSTNFSRGHGTLIASAGKV